VWLTGSYDPELNLTYRGVGNPGPDWNPDQRGGDNLYSSLVALDADTGKPNDRLDYDADQLAIQRCEKQRITKIAGRSPLPREDRGNGHDY